MTSWRNRREAELWALCHSDPLRIVTLFEQYTGVYVGQELPPNQSFRLMIETILDHEEKCRQPPKGESEST